MGSRIEPGKAAPQALDMEVAALQVMAIDVTDLEFAAIARPHVGCNLNDVAVVEIESRNRPIGSWTRRFLFDGGRASVLVEIYHAVALGVGHTIAEYRGASPAGDGRAQSFRESVAEEYVVSEGQRTGVAADEVLADQEGLGTPSGLGCRA